jgi:hypothetical protein
MSGPPSRPDEPSSPPGQPSTPSRRPSQVHGQAASSATEPPTSPRPSPIQAPAATSATEPPTSRRPSASATRSDREKRAEAAQAEERRGSTMRLISALYRLVKACQLYDDANQTVQQAVPIAAEALTEYCTLFATDTVRVLFSSEMVFVARRILRAPRESYGLALQLGAMLEHCGLNELTLERAAKASSLLRLARLLVDAQRAPNLAQELRTSPIPGVGVGRTVLADDWAADQQESPVARVVKGYAAAILIVKSFYARLANGDHRGANEVKRVAQKLVALGMVHPGLLVATAAAPLPDDDRPRRAVSSAVLALAMTRQLTEDRVVLTNVVLGALLAEAGHPRLGPNAAIERLAPSSLIVLAQLGMFYETAIKRAVVAYEALGLEDPSLAAEGMASSVTLPAVLLRTARQFNELRTPRKGTTPLGIDEAIQQLDAMATEDVEVSAVRLLVSGLGFFPQGSLVELTSGEVAMVAGAPRLALDFARPPVRILTDVQHRALSTPIELSLAEPGPGQPERSIRRALVGGAVPGSLR